MFCKGCKTEHERSAFYPRSEGRPGVRQPCKRKLNEGKNKWPKGAEAVARNRAKRIEVNAQIRALKEGRPCADCGRVYHHAVMQFDHLDESTKAGNVADLAHKGFSFKRIEIEIAKCQLVCANCHAFRTWRRAHPGVHAELLVSTIVRCSNEDDRREDGDRATRD